MATAERERSPQGPSAEDKSREELAATYRLERRAITVEHDLDREDWDRINTYDPDDPTFGYPTHIRAQMIADEKADAVAQALGDRFARLTAPARIHLLSRVILGIEVTESAPAMPPGDHMYD